MYTGRYPHSNGVLGLTHGGFGWDLHPGEEHLCTALRQAGYRTGGIGVIHETRHPERCGFHELQAGEYAGAEVVERCEAFLHRHAGATEPFYLQVGFFEPHRRFDFGGATPDESQGIEIPPFLKDEPSARAELSAFQGAIHQLDTAVGRLLDALAARGLDQNTLLIFAADHGIPFPRAKCSLYDPGLAAALILRWPARGWSGGRVVESMISNVDYFPTLLEAIGLPAPRAMQGVSFAPLLDGRTHRSRREVFAEMTYHQYFDPMRCIRTERFKLICNFVTGPSFMNPSQTYRPATVTVVPPMPEYAMHPDLELFDLATDAKEFRNLAGDRDHAAIETELLERLHGWMLETGDPLLAGVPESPQHRRLLGRLKRAVAPVRSGIAPVSSVVD